MVAIWFVVHKYYNIHINIMTDRGNNQPGPSTIVKNTKLWPTSFTKPEKQTRVCITTYIFKESTKVQKFLDFLKENFPNRNVDVKQLDNGGTSVTSVNDTKADDPNGCCSADLKDSRIGPYTCCISNGDGPYWRCCCNDGSPTSNFRCTGSKGCKGGPTKGFVTPPKCNN